MDKFGGLSPPSKTLGALGPPAPPLASNERMTNMRIHPLASLLHL